MKMEWCRSGCGSSSSSTGGGGSSSSYDVFLSFRGPDTRKTFVDVLYTSLRDAGVWVFRDNEELPFGQRIHSEIVQAIRCSKISIPILSKCYASSKSCLMEVAQMVECSRAGDHTILPIFYDVEPSVVKNQKEALEAAFHDHERDGIDPETIDKWKEALRAIGELKGWELARISDGHYSKLIRLVVSHVLKMLKKGDLVVPENLVGVDDHIEEIMRKLDVVSSDVRIVGIHGISGTGKTTLAKVVYNKLWHLFDSCSFIENIREKYEETNGIMHLQRQLVSDLLKQKSRKFSSYDEGVQFIKHRFCYTKVLILLDDVDQCRQLKELVGERCWFGQGTRIIVTSRKSDVFDMPAVVEKYQVESMEKHQALELFCWHAFGGSAPQKGFHNLCGDIVSITGGLPLALEVIGSVLFNKTKEFWEDTLRKLKEKPAARIEEKLMISYEYLDDWQKQIFLDIACFFVGKDLRIPFYMWEDCKLFPSSGIESLILLSLVKIGNNCELWMHDQLRDLGREIVRKENPLKPGKRSRLWNHEEAFSTLSKRKGTQKVEALNLTFNEECLNYFTCLEFDGLSNLRFLKLDRANIEGNLKSCLPTLRWLDWEGCSNTADLLNFYLEKLAILDLSSSQVSQDRDTWSQIMKMAKELKVLNLKDCANLRGSPYFPTQMALKLLILESCSRLMRLDSSISNLKDLKSLNLKFCHELTHLADGLGCLKELKELLVDGTSIRKIHFPKGSMEQLEILSACGCRSLVQITDSIGNLKSLIRLALDDSIIARLPNSIGSLVKLQQLSLRNCQNLLELPNSVGNLKLLLEVDLSNTKIDELPCSFKNLENLKVLKMEGCFLREFPSAVTNLKKLEEIDFSLCRSLSGEISSDITELSSLRILRLSHTEISGITDKVGGLSHLQTLDLLECKKLQRLPTLPPSLTSLNVGSGMLDVAPNFANLENLRGLNLAVDLNRRKPNDLEWISSLSKLETFQLCLPNLTDLRLPQQFTGLSQLRKLALSNVDMSYLQHLPSGLSTLSLRHCALSAKSPDLSNLKCLVELELLHCELARIYGLEHLEALQVLKISHCSIKSLDGLEHLSNLRVLTLSHCECLEVFPYTPILKMLQEEEIEFCKFQYPVEDRYDTATS